MSYDFQVNRVYRFDSKIMALMGDMDLPRPIIPMAIKQMCDRYEVEAPSVEFEPRRRVTSSYYPSLKLIKFPTNPHTGHHHLAIVCHETAHHIQQTHKLGADEPDHGPTFVRLYIQLLAEFGSSELNFQDLMYEARKMGIKVSEFPK